MQWKCPFCFNMSEYDVRSFFRTVTADTHRVSSSKLGCYSSKDLLWGSSYPSCSNIDFSNPSCEIGAIFFWHYQFGMGGIWQWHS